MDKLDCVDLLEQINLWKKGTAAVRANKLANQAMQDRVPVVDPEEEDEIRTGDGKASPVYKRLKANAQDLAAMTGADAKAAGAAMDKALRQALETSGAHGSVNVGCVIDNMSPDAQFINPNYDREIRAVHDHAQDTPWTPRHYVMTVGK